MRNAKRETAERRKRRSNKEEYEVRKQKPYRRSMPLDAARCRSMPLDDRSPVSSQNYIFVMLE
jgi:hypothetical protein